MTGWVGLSIPGEGRGGAGGSRLGKAKALVSSSTIMCSMAGKNVNHVGRTND